MEWRHGGDNEDTRDDSGDDGGGAVGAGIVGDTDWRERAARARMEQRKRVAKARKRGEHAT